MRILSRPARLLAALGGMLRPPQPTVQIVGDIYLDVIAAVDELPQWDGDTSIQSPIETVAGGSALNTAVQLSALLRTRRQSTQSRPIRGCTLHSRVGADLYGDLVAGKIRDAGVALSAARRGGQGVCICLSGQRDRSFVSYKGTVAEFNEEDLDLRRLLALRLVGNLPWRLRGHRPIEPSSRLRGLRLLLHPPRLSWLGGSPWPEQLAAACAQDGDAVPTARRPARATCTSPRTTTARGCSPRCRASWSARALSAARQ